MSHLLGLLYILEPIADCPLADHSSRLLTRKRLLDHVFVKSLLVSFESSHHIFMGISQNPVGEFTIAIFGSPSSCPYLIRKLLGWTG